MYSISGVKRNRKDPALAKIRIRGSVPQRKEIFKSLLNESFQMIFKAFFLKLSKIFIQQNFKNRPSFEVLCNEPPDSFFWPKPDPHTCIYLQFVESDLFKAHKLREDRPLRPYPLLELSGHIFGIFFLELQKSSVCLVARPLPQGVI